MSTMHDDTLPPTCQEIRSTTVTEGGHVILVLHETEVRAPRERQVTGRIEAAPVNPSDLGTMLAGADLSTAAALSTGGPGVQLDLPPAASAAQAGRLGTPVPCGNEGGGVVVAAGSSPEARALLGRTVGFVAGGSYARYRTIAVDQCFPMPEGTTSEQAAAPFLNPLTALGMVETMRDEGHTAIVHTVGASNLGLMLNRLCQADEVPLANIVRRPEHVDLLHGLGAEHVVDSSADWFLDDLTQALEATGATIAFDAIGGGELASTLLACMERIASAPSGEFSRYGSTTHKQVDIYGGLDRSPTVLRRDFGMSWGVGSWLLRPYLARIGDDRTERLRRRDHDDVRERIRVAPVVGRRRRPHQRTGVRPASHGPKSTRHSPRAVAPAGAGSRGPG